MYFEEFNNCKELNQYLENHPEVTVMSWQSVKLCTGDTVIMVEFIKRPQSTKTVLNESNVFTPYEVK